MIIKTLETMEQIRQVAGVEARTWGMEAGTTVPDHLLKAISCEGGLLLGAYQDDRLVGFTLGWLGTVESGDVAAAAGRLKLVSHMTGVIPDLRDQRIGFQLKLAQREWALERDLDLVTWTYDPLESRNAYFNHHLLGCRCRTYLEDYYGEMRDEMNAGIPSDRFRVDWWIRSPEVEAALAGAGEGSGSQPGRPGLVGEDIPLLNPAGWEPGGLPHPGAAGEEIPGSRIWIEIPPDYQSIRAGDPSLALAWRVHAREIFQRLFAAGWQVVDFRYQRRPHRRSYYLVEKYDADH